MNTTATRTRRRLRRAQPPPEVRRVLDRSAEIGGMMEELLPFLDETMTDERREMIKATADKQRSRVSKHKYSLERFGLDADVIRQECAFVYDDLMETPSASASDG